MALPKGWVECALHDVNDVIAGQSPESQYYNMNNEGLPFFQGKTDFGKVYPTNRIYCTNVTKTAQCGDILLSVRAPVGPTNLARETVGIGRGINAIHPLGGIDSWFILYFFRSIEPTFSGTGTGTTFNAVTVDKVRNLSIPLPPLAEQHRIITKVDALFSELDKGVDCLQTIKTQLKTYRQAVLKWAFEGKYEYQLFGNITTSRLGKMLDKNKNKGTNKPYIRNINVRWFEFDLTDLLQMRFNENENEQFDIIKGDLVICEGGEPGRCAIWKSDDSIKYQKALHRVRPNENVSSEYLMYYIRHIVDTGKISEYFTGTGIKHLTGESLRRIPVPVQEISKQHDIVAAIESRLSICDKLEQLVDENITNSEALRQSILKKAFEGRLVPQDPNDESADILLNRIKSQKSHIIRSIRSNKHAKG
jgi:type I restriction enzyme S subunit